jgi:hypothetical protein
MLESMGMSVSYAKNKGVVLEKKESICQTSVFDFKDVDLRTLQLLKIAVYS